MADSLLTRMRAAFDVIRGREQKNSTLDLFREIYGEGRQSATGKTVDVNAALRVGAALACSRVISQGVASMPLKLMRQTGNSVEPAYDHRLFKLLAVQPNNLQSAYELRESMVLHAVLCGNAYAWTPMSSRGVSEMYLLEPAWVRMRHTWPDEPLYDITPSSGERFTISGDEVWHLKGPSWGAYVGLETVALAREALGLSLSIEETQAQFQHSGVRTSGFMSVDGTLADEQAKKLMRWIEQNHSGSTNAGRAMILDRGARWVSQTMTNTDAQMIEQRKFQIEDTCRFFGVMPLMIGGGDKAQTYASAEQMFLAHLIHCLGPWLARIESSANRWLLSQQERAQGYYFKHVEKAVLRMSASEQASYLDTLTNNGTLTRNEARALLDLNPIEGLDKPLEPAGRPAATNSGSDE